MLTREKFLLAILVEAAILSGCAGGKANLQPQEKPVQAVVKTEPVVRDTVQEKKLRMEANGKRFREGWTQLKAGMTIGEVTNLFGSDLGLGYCNQPNACQWNPRLSYFGFPDINGVTFKFNAAKLTEWSPSDLPPKE